MPPCMHPHVQKKKEENKGGKIKESGRERG